MKLQGSPGKNKHFQVDFILPTHVLEKFVLFYEHEFEIKSCMPLV